jgi:hypothetical protein
MKPRLLQIYNNGFINAKLEELPNEDTHFFGSSQGINELPLIDKPIDFSNTTIARKQIFPLIRPINYNLNPLYQNMCTFICMITIFLSWFYDFTLIHKDRKQKLVILSVPALNHLKENSFSKLLFFLLSNRPERFVSLWADSPFTSS